MKRTLSILAIMAIASIAFGNGVNLNSPGTRALSMGGAYITIVDDYSAPYWNPAGLMNSEGMQATFFLTDIIPNAEYKRDDYGIDAVTETNHYMAPNAAFLWNCMMVENMRMGLSLIVPAGLGTEWDGDDFVAFSGPQVLVDQDLNPIPNPYTGDPTIPNILAGTTFDWESKIAIMNFSLSAAYKFSDRLNVGGALHLVYGTMSMKRGEDLLTQYGFAQGTGLPVDTLIYSPGSDKMLDTQYDEESSGFGFGAGFGFQYEATEKLSIGAALRTPMKVGFSGDATFGTTKYDFDRDITFPLWIGGGLAFRPTEKLLLAAEAQWTQWSETQDYLIADYETIGKDSLVLLWEDAVQIRFGAEYTLNEKVALRGGFYIDPAPSPDETMTILIPNSDILGYTVGVGYKLEKLTFDVTFEYLKGKTRDITNEEVEELGVGMPGTHDFDVIAPSIAITYHF